MASEDHYLAVLKASFDYEPQDDADDELAIKENQILFLIERTDDSWWKVKLKTDTPDEQGATGLVPAAYVEEAERISIAKVLYDYQADQPTELTVQEDEILHVYEKDDGWLLVQSQKPGGGVGYVPENYTEETSDEGDAQETPAPSAPSRIVIPDSPPRPEYVDPAERVGSNRVQADDIQTWAVSEVDKKGKKKKGTLGIGNGAIFFASESDKTPVQKWQMTDIESHRIEKNKHVHIDIEGSNATHLHFHAGSKDTAEAIVKKLESSKALSAPAPSSPQAGPSNSRPSPPPEIERPRSAVPKAVHFDDAEPVIIPDEEEEEEHHAPPPRAERPRYVPEPDPEPEPEPVPAPRAAARVTRRDDDEEYATALYDFTADGDDELTITRENNWWFLTRILMNGGKSGTSVVWKVSFLLNMLRYVSDITFAFIGFKCSVIIIA
ncbi:hypothetical protein NLI96_g8680 [Meripilus lineatus]|uniref:SH3 domain-containing protein n=1 Tax=Meripilus lineatus TaxID=2056292 RepID=A0AAD5YBT1_9APHY|nr:hypothetical protein NLI96_g8680 [Physisporinus lineatus]